MKLRVPTRFTLWLIGCAVAVGAGILLWRYSHRPAPSDDASPRLLQKPASPPGGYVGSGTCAECHPQISEQFRRHPMGRSARVVSPRLDADPKIAPTTFTPAAGLEFQVVQERGRVFHRKEVKDQDGNLICSQSVPVAYAIGSGRRGRSYLIRRDEMLFVSPIAWYSEKRRWDLSPQYRPFHNDGFERPVTHACLRCHVGRVNPSAVEQESFRDPPFHEVSIGCENCHGPGRRHVAFRRATNPAGADPIVNPAKLSPNRRESVCAQCHLSSQGVVLRYGRGPHDFRPGMRLSDVLAVFVPREPQSAGKAVSHVQQFQSSRCFQKSGGNMGCTSCHNPHSVPRKSERDAHFRNRCLKCHGPGKSECSAPIGRRNSAPFDNSCVRCHMPRFDASDVPHTAQTDHRILRTAEPAGPHSLPRSVAEMRIFDEDNAEFPAIERERARNLLRARIAHGTGNPNQATAARDALLPILKRAPDDVETLDALARCEVVLRNPGEAVQYWNRLLKVSPQNQSALYELSGYLVETGRTADALPRIDQMLKINGWFSDVHWNRSFALAQSGRLPEALKAAEKAVELEPSNPRFHHWLAEMHRRQGNPIQAAKSRRTAEQLDAVRRRNRQN